MNSFDRCVGGSLRAVDLEVLQVNLGLKCNQVCTHCHVQAGPGRDELMSRDTMLKVVAVADAVKPRYVDITGGSPELHPLLREFIAALRTSGHQVQVRTNLTVLLEPDQEGLPEFFKDHGVALVASLPCYLEENVDAMRGPGTYRKSIEVLKRLNALGYGSAGGLGLDLVYNPSGPFLAPSQAGLEADYKRELNERHGIVFDNLLTISNLPIGRFAERLRDQGQDLQYLRLLKDSFNPRTLDGLMCRHQLNVGWDGTLYDCDFNMILGLPVNHGLPSSIRDFYPPAVLSRTIVTGDHCFGCTAGAGSSCRGALDL